MHSHPAPGMTPAPAPGSSLGTTPVTQSLQAPVGGGVELHWPNGEVEEVTVLDSLNLTGECLVARPRVHPADFDYQIAVHASWLHWKKTA